VNLLTLPDQGVGLGVAITQAHTPHPRHLSRRPVVRPATHNWTEFAVSPHPDDIDRHATGYPGPLCVS